MTLKGKKCAMLVEEGFEDLELWYPVIRLREEGAEVVLVGTGSATTYRGKYGLSATADVTAGEVSASDFAAVLVPGGWAPDKLRRYPEVLDLVAAAYKEGKVIAAICHAPWVLISAKILPGHTVTCVSAIKDDVENAGAKYVDAEVVKSGNIITSRTPADLPAFCREIIAALREQ
ncbi:MAG TPA: type 1 glutamine amidotransferase [Firmicutes bacterium]|nr:type 1 glutamine amidotransferase [Bacillota bacterium]